MDLTLSLIESRDALHAPGPPPPTGGARALVWSSDPARQRGGARAAVASSTSSAPASPMMNLQTMVSKTVRAVHKLGGGTRQKCKLTLVIKRIVLEGSEHGYVAVELSRGLKSAVTPPMPLKDGLVLTGGMAGSGAAGAQELSIISTLERTADNEQCEKVFKLSIKRVNADARGRMIDGDSRVLGAVEIDIADFVGSSDPAQTQPQARSWSVPCRKGDKHITIETICSARPVSTRKEEQSEESSVSDMSTHGGSDDESTVDLMKVKAHVQKTFTGTDVMLSALKYQDGGSVDSSAVATPQTPVGVISPPMLGIGAGAAGVSESPLNPVSLTISRLTSDVDPTAVPSKVEDSGAIRPSLTSLRLPGELRTAPVLPTEVTSSSGEADAAGFRVNKDIVVRLSSPKKKQQWEDEEGWFGNDIGKTEFLSPKCEMQRDESDRSSETVGSLLPHRKFQELEFELETRTNDLAASALQLEKRAQELRAKDDRIAELEMKMKKLEAKCEETERQHNSVLEERKEEYTRQIEQKTRELEEREKEHGRVQAEIVASGAKELERLAAKHATSLADAEEETRRCKDKFAIADHEMAVMEKELADAADKANSLEGEVSRLQALCDKLTADLDDEMQRAEKEADIALELSARAVAEHERERELERKKAMAQQDLIASQQEELKALSQRAETCEEALLEATKDRELLRDQLDLQRQREEEILRLGEARALELKCAQDQVEQWRAASAEQERECATLKEDVARRDLLLAESRKTSEEEAQKMHEEITRFEAKLRDKMARCNGLEERLLAEQAEADSSINELKTRLHETEKLLVENERSANREHKQQQAQQAQQLQQEIEKFQGRNRVLTDRVARAELSAEQSIARARQGEEARAALEQRIGSLEAQVEASNKEVIKASEAAMLSGTRMEELERERAEYQDREQENGSKMCGLREELNVERSTLAAIRIQLEGSTAELDQLRTDFSSLEREHAAGTQHLETVQERLEEAERTRTLQERTLQESCEAREGLTKDVSELRQRCSEMEMSLAAKEKDMQALAEKARNVEVQLRRSQAELEALQEAKVAAEEEVSSVKRQNKETIAQHKNLCSRLEADLQSKQALLVSVREEAIAAKETSSQLSMELDEIKRQEKVLKSEREEFEQQRSKWQKERIAWEENMENREATSAQVREKMEMTEAMTREQENATDPKESEHKMLEQVQETKEKEQGGGVKSDGSCDFCSMLKAQEEMLLKGLGTHCAMLDVLAQKFPSLGARESQRIMAKDDTASRCIKEDKEQLLPDQKADSCSPSRPSDEGCSDTPKTSDEYELLVAELKEELKRVRADADLEVSALGALIFHIFCSH